MDGPETTDGTLTWHVLAERYGTFDRAVEAVASGVERVAPQAFARLGDEFVRAVLYHQNRIILDHLARRPHWSVRR